MESYKIPPDKHSQFPGQPAIDLAIKSIQMARREDRPMYRDLEMQLAVMCLLTGRRVKSLVETDEIRTLIHEWSIREQQNAADEFREEMK